MDNPFNSFENEMSYLDTLHKELTGDSGTSKSSPEEIPALTLAPMASPKVLLQVQQLTAPKSPAKPSTAQTQPNLIGQSYPNITMASAALRPIMTNSPFISPATIPSSPALTPILPKLPAQSSPTAPVYSSKPDQLGIAPPPNFISAPPAAVGVSTPNDYQKRRIY